MRLASPSFCLYFFFSYAIGQTDNGCKVTFLGKTPLGRLKLRPTTKNYPKFNGGDPISSKEVSESAS